MERQKTSPRIRGTTPGLALAARELRRQPTPAERVLWEANKGKQLGGLRFRNEEVLQNLPSVLSRIASTASALKSTPRRD